MASGTRRIEAVAGRAAARWLLDEQARFHDTMNALGAARSQDIPKRIAALNQPATDAKALLRMLLHSPVHADSSTPVATTTDIDPDSGTPVGSTGVEVRVYILDPGDDRDATVSLLSSKTVSYTHLTLPTKRIV